MKSATSTRGGRKSSVPDAKLKKREYSFVSPTSPEGPVSLASIRLLLKEALEPINIELGQLHQTLESASEQLKEVASLPGRIKELESENAVLKCKLEGTIGQCKNLEEKICTLEGYSRRNNLKFSQMRGFNNLNVSSQAKCEAQILEIFSNIGLQITSSEIEHAHPIGGPVANRPVIVRFGSFKTRQKVLHEREKLVY